MNANYFLFGLRLRKQGNCFFLLMIAFLCCQWVLAQTPCDRPSAMILQSISTNSATITWTPPTQQPWYGYDYWYTTIPAFVPTSSTTPNGSVSTPGVTLDLTGLIPGTTNYFFVRSRCGTVTGNTYSTWLGPLTFTSILPGTSCPEAPFGQNPAETYSPLYTGSPEVINTDAYAGEYSRVNFIQNRQYIFDTSNPGDFITITNANLTSILAYGPAPLTWNSTNNSGVLRYYISTNSSCGTQQVERTRFITAQLVPSACESPTNLFTYSISNTSAILNWTQSANSQGYQYYVSTNSTTPGINVTPTGSTNFTYQERTGLSPNTTYYYWIRSICGTTFSNWVSGGSFTTQSGVIPGCTGALYGQDPPNDFVPACSGSPEIITTTSWAGNYSNVKVIPNKTYTFTSSVATDFITLRDDLTSISYASGITPLVWSSGANTTTLKVFIHTNSTCGSQNINRTIRVTCQSAAQCNAPSSYVISAITATSANIGWTAANPSPSNGYQYYYNTTNATPTAATAPSGSTTAVTLNLTGLSANTTYYFWVRSNCGSTQGNWVFGNSFTTVGNNAGCTSAVNGLYPTATFTPTCFGNNEVIVTDAYAGEYTNVSISSNTQYTFTSSISSDYITITNADATVTYIAGLSPLVWVSGSNNGVIRYFLHANAACDSQNTNRTRYIGCQAATTCNTPSGLSASGITTSGATLNWNAANPAPANGYQVYLSTSSTAPTAATAPTGNISTTSAAASGLNAGTTYYYWVRSNCGTSQSNWVGGTTFTTSTSTVIGCTSAIWPQFPSFTYVPSCTGSAETIVTNAYTGEYSVISVQPNRQYTFASSISTDYITISNADGTILRAGGVTPLVWLSGSNSGLMRYYFHGDAACDTSDASERSKFITCTAALANDDFDWSTFKLYPNPTTGILNIADVNTIDTVEVYNILGQSIMYQTLKALEGKIDMSKLAVGTYFVKATANDKSKVFKVIKEY